MPEERLVFFQCIESRLIATKPGWCQQSPATGARGPGAGRYRVGRRNGVVLRRSGAAACTCSVARTAPSRAAPGQAARQRLSTAGGHTRVVGFQNLH